MKDHQSLNAESLVVAAGRQRAPGSPLNVPLVPASNFILGGDREYVRGDGTDTWDALETVIGGLEGGNALVFSSGMGAIASVFDQLAAGSVIALPDECYQGTVGLAEDGQAKGRWTVKRIAVEDTDEWIRACNYADLVWLESPSNPMLRISDVKAICAAPRKPGALLAVDNTFATPLNQRPLELGADFSVQSATKYIGGHSDMLAGVVSTSSPGLLEGLKATRVYAGATLGSLEAFLALRGIRTMALRLERAQKTAMELASRLEAHPQVTITRYPGLASHPGHELARAQLGGFGTIISFDIQGGAEAADAMCTSVGLIQHATSLGAVESTMERRAAVHGQEHLPPSMLRLSVGIENVDDLWDDLEQALERGAK
ncbi:MAG: PLP-dependent transferase [Chromatiales bacterium]|nr:PLP-dependent transferase [Chromatiales bacterium]